MRRVRLPSLLGPAALLYLVAEGASAQGELDLLGVVVTLTAVVTLLVPGLLLRDASLDGTRSVQALATLSALGLSRYAAPSGLSLVLDVTHALCASSVAALLLGIGLADRRLARRHVLSWPLALGISSAALALCAVLPTMPLLGRLWIAPASFEHAPGLAILVAALGSIWARWTRPKLLASPGDLAQDTWVLLGLVPFTVVVLCVLGAALVGATLPSAFLWRVVIALCVLGLVAGHARALDPEKKLHAARAARAIVRGGLTLAITTAAVLFFEQWLRGQPALVLVLSSLLVAAVTHRALEPFVQRWLAPAEGRLLDAIERAHAQLGHVSRLEQVAAVTLGALRAATGDPSARALLYVSEPELELSLDAAGLPRTELRPMPEPIGRILRARRGELIVRGPLEAQIVRNPPLRPLVAALCELDALCVVPLIWEGELEGALVLPRAERTSQLALEEITAIDGLSRHVSGLLSVLSAEARAHARATAAEGKERTAKAALEQGAQESSRLRAELHAAYALGMTSSIEARPLAYGPLTRALLHELSQVAVREEPWLLSTERGLAVETYARIVHDGSLRKDGPFVVVRCASLPLDECVPALFGQVESGRLGALELARDGTLLLLDACALAPDAQARLAQQIAGARPGEARIVASVRDAGSEPALLRELRERFSGSSRLPPLRERKEDLPSLCLLALDRACRVLGAPPVGLAPEAQARLLQCELHGNLLDLEAVLEHAARHCAGSRIERRELEASLQALSLAPSTRSTQPVAPTEATPQPDHSLEGLERRALQSALERCSGNKSEAARMLGLKRTTFLDKLRRHGLDRPPGSAVN